MKDTPAISNSYGEFYSIDVNPNPGLKEKILKTYGPDSKQACFLNELENFLNNKKECNLALQPFKAYVRSHSLVPKNTDYLAILTFFTIPT